MITLGRRLRLYSRQAGHLARAIPIARARSLRLAWFNAKRSLGMRTMREDGVRKVLAGLTTIDEVVSITVGDAT